MGLDYAPDFIHSNIRLPIFSVIPYCLNINVNILKTGNISPHFQSTAEWGRQRGALQPNHHSVPKKFIKPGICKTIPNV